jgi:5'-nucleotidase
MIILVDQDDVLADFEGHFISTWQKIYPDKFYIPLEQRTVFFIEQQYPAELRPLAQEIMDGQGFYRELPPKKGGIEAVLEMSTKNEVLICTSPRSQSKYCIAEKQEWVQKYLGEDWLNRLIITMDKTTVNGDILIDDKPIITGSRTPIWEHILYDMPYNRHIKDKRRLTWDNWREILKL